MTVEIPISANAGGVVQAFREIQNAISRAKGEAIDFAAIDLSHSEVGSLGAELKQVAKNIEDLVRVGRGSTASAFRGATGLSMNSSVGEGDVAGLLDSYPSGIKRRYPDRAERQRHINNVMSYVTRGTSFMTEAPAGSASDEDMAGDGQPEPGAGGGGSLPARRSGSFFRRTGGMLGRGLGGLLAGEGGAAAGETMGAAALGLAPEVALPLLAIAGISSVGKMVGQGVQGAMSEDRADDSLLRTLQGSSSDFNSLRDAARQAAQGLMITYEQSAQLGATFAQIANISDPNRAFTGMRGAVGYGNAIGMDAGSATSAFASASLLGMDPARFADLIEEAASKGNMTSQTPQVLQAILSFAQNASRSLVTGGAIAGASGNFASMYASLNASGDPGLHGSNAEALLSSINSSVMGGGNAGLAGQVATYEALARAGVTDPFHQQMDLSAGAFAPILSNQKGVNDVYDALRINLFSQYKNPMQRAYAESMYFSGSNSQMHAWATIDKLNPADLSQTQSYLNSLGISPDKVNLNALPDITNFISGHTSASQVRASLLSSGNLSDADKAAITGASGPDDLKKALVRAMNDSGMGQDDSTKLQQAQVDASNKLEATMSALVPVVTKMDSDLAALLTPLQTISADLDMVFGRAAASGSSFPGAAPPASAAMDKVLSGAGMSPTFFTDNAAPSNGYPNSKGATRGQRNNNPLDLTYVPGQPGAYSWDSGGGFHFGQYHTVNDGLAAAARQIQMYINRGDKTLALVDADYSGKDPAANPNEAALLMDIYKKTGLNSQSDMTNPQNLAAYIAAKALVESGSRVTLDQALTAVKTSGSLTVYVKYPDGKTSKHTAPVTHAFTPKPHNAASAPAVPGASNVASAPSNVPAPTP